MSVDRKPVDALAFGMMVLLCMLWGFQPITMKLAAPHISLVMQAGVRSILAALFLLGVWACARTERDLGVHDHPGIVWDEIVGMLVTLFLAPAGWAWLLIGFGLFRLFDIWKPYPISWLNDHVKGGWGIMLDDLAAGMAAAASLQALAWLYGH